MTEFRDKADDRGWGEIVRATTAAYVKRMDRNLKLIQFNYAKRGPKRINGSREGAPNPGPRPDGPLFSSQE